MRSSPMRIGLLAIALLGAAQAQVTYQDLASPKPSNWVTYSGAWHSQRHSALKQIHTGNVSSLVPKWIYHVPGAGRLETVPLVVDGGMYISQPNACYWIDAQAGAPSWGYRHKQA